jgi:glycerol kinase
MEGIAMLTAGLLDAAARSLPLGRISIDGGLSQSRYFAQFLASASHRQITVPPMHEWTALGLAELCGLDVATVRAGASTFASDGSVTPQDHARFAQAVQRSRGWRNPPAAP